MTSFLALSLLYGVPVGSATQSLPGSASQAQPSVGAFSAPASGTTTAAPLSLAISDAPTTICAGGSNDCPAGVGSTRVTLQASALAPPEESWPNVQIAFVIDTTAFAGDYGTDTPGQDPCALLNPGGPICEESNGIPFFVAHAAEIAEVIQEANPHSHVSFALIDYYDSWGSPWDDADGPEYHVDIGQFVSLGEFGSDVTATFQQEVLDGLWYNWDQDMDNDFLDSSSITALYGALVGSDLDWSSGAHHVIVWMGTTAPRAQGYEQDYCVSSSAWLVWDKPANCYSQICEPSYAFPTGASPQCEGWTSSENGNPLDSIAALARTAPSCVDSAGGRCVIDTIDTWSTATDPFSKGWPIISKTAGSGPGGALVEQNVARVLQAGCAMAQATGGSWDGPDWYTCPDGQTGNLEYVAHGPVATPDKTNPTLLNAFRAISFGPVLLNGVAQGDSHPLFSFVPWAGVSIAPDPEWETSCVTPSGYASDCPRVPTNLTSNGVLSFGWNWSSNATQNAMTTGDTWTAQFNVIVSSPSGALMPLDACTTALCLAGGSGALAGGYTMANYLAYKNTTELTTSFPLATVTVVSAASSALPPSPTAPPPTPPGFPTPNPALQGVLNPSTVVLQTPVSNVTAQGVAAGLLGAGFVRVTQRNRPIAVSVAAMSGPSGKRPGSPPSIPSRFE